jgi:type III pantothenate kinase
MTLVVDIGNTNIVCGVYHKGSLIWHARFKTDSLRTADEYYALLSSMKTGVWEISSIKSIALASVVPDMTRIWQHLFRKYFQVEALVINAYSPLGITFMVKDPGFIGADLIANAFGAWKKHQKSCIVVDLGTATTIQLITATGLFKGAVIAPGIRTAAAKLFEKAALIPEIELVTPTVILGTNTTDAVLSGVVKGHAFMVESFLNEIRQQNLDNEPFQTVLTGGIADLMAPLIPSHGLVDKTLTLDGLYLSLNHINASQEHNSL